MLNQVLYIYCMIGKQWDLFANQTIRSAMRGISQFSDRLKTQDLDPVNVYPRGAQYLLCIHVTAVNVDLLASAPESGFRVQINDVYSLNPLHLFRPPAVSFLSMHDENYQKWYSIFSDFVAFFLDLNFFYLKKKNLMAIKILKLASEMIARNF